MQAIVASLLLAVSSVLVSAKAAAPTDFSHYVTFDMDIGDKPAGQLKFGLYGRIVPKTALNFFHLAVGDKEVQGAKRTYSGSVFHRVIKNFMIQGGDITKGYEQRAHRQ